LITESFANFFGPSIVQSDTSFLSKRQVLQINSSTSLNRIYRRADIICPFLKKHELLKLLGVKPE
jgi:hypothetical protein